MNPDGSIIRIATRGSALALAQSNCVMNQCRAAFPKIAFELQIIKTTGDKLQTLSLTNPKQELPKGLFTKELEAALLSGEADFAVHSLKDLPTELPDGLKVGAVSEREDARDVLIFREGLPQGAGSGTLDGFAPGATIATSSTRRQAQILALRGDLKVAPIRGNVGTRLNKLAERSEFDGIVLAAAGLNRLGIRIGRDGKLPGESRDGAVTDVPNGLRACHFSFDEMLPCVGQAALGIETRQNDARMDEVCKQLNHVLTHQCVLAERSFLRAMGGGCLSPVAALATHEGGQLRLRAVSFRNETARRCELWGEPADADQLGRTAAARLA